MIGRGRGQVDVVADQHRLADLLGLGRSPPQPLVSTIVPAPAATAVRTPCTTGVDAAALVEVGAAQEDQGALVARLGPYRADPAGVAGHGGGRGSRAGR